jgi:arylsulfatase A-like enzyme
VTGQRPNILLVVMDTARADAFAPYGASATSTPAVSQLAAGGQAQQMFAPACWTVPSHASMFSGLLYRDARFGMPAKTHADYKAAGDLLTDRWLPVVLGRAGYETAAVSTNMWISPQSGFDRGFDRYSQLTGARSLHLASSSWRERLEWSWQTLRASVDDGAQAVENLLRNWLASRGEAPFFWFVNLVECHSPYLPPRPYNRLSASSRLRAADEARRYLNFDAIWKGLCSTTDAPGPALERMRTLYADSVRLMDDWLARVLEGLERGGLLDETIVIVTSDHGENLGEDGLLGHGFSLDDRLIRVPFVAGGPAAPWPSPLASLVDVPAWLARSVVLDHHPWDALQAREVAVAQFDAPCGPDDEAADLTISTWGLGAAARRRLTTSFACATNGRQKLLRRLGREELVDLVADPLEAAPVVVDAAIEARWAGELTALRAALDQSETAEAGVTGMVTPEGSSDEMAELEGQMKLLGYL